MNRKCVYRMPRRSFSKCWRNSKLTIQIKNSGRLLLCWWMTHDGKLSPRRRSVKIYFRTTWISCTCRNVKIWRSKERLVLRILGRNCSGTLTPKWLIIQLLGICVWSCFRKIVYYRQCNRWTLWEFSRRWLTPYTSNGDRWFDRSFATTESHFVNYCNNQCPKDYCPTRQSGVTTFKLSSKNPALSIWSGSRDHSPMSCSRILCKQFARIIKSTNPNLSYSLNRRE